MKIASIVDQRLNEDLLNKSELWVSMFRVSMNEEITSIKPTRVKVSEVLDESHEKFRNISIVGYKEKDSVYINFIYSEEVPSICQIYTAGGKYSVYDVEFFETKKEADKYYKRELKNYMKHYGNLINKIKGYGI